MSLSFSGRVAVITGAGGGLGREYALLLARKGASVVVNDLGGGPTGDGKSNMADNVVKEIMYAGGKAVANYDSVEHGDKIIKTAIDNFGRIDILINNAGILRDRSFANMSTDDFHKIMVVHLFGSYVCTKAAWPYMRKQNFGRILMTSSTSGIYGNFGQANYGAAKMALVGLTNATAIEGAKYNIKVNTIVPTAGSRLTKDIIPEDVFKLSHPKHVAPLAAYLCHESCEDTGTVYVANAGWYGRLRWFQNEGAVLAKPDEQASVEAIRDAWPTISSMANSKAYANGQEFMMHTLDMVGKGPQISAAPFSGTGTAGGGGPMNPDLCRGYVLPEIVKEYDTSGAILYALGVGATLKSEGDIRFLYEGHENFAVLPTFGVTFGFGFLGLDTHIPGFKLDLPRLLHGEEYIEFFKPLPPSGKVKIKCQVADLVDKGSGALLLLDVDVRDEQGDKLAFLQVSCFIVGSGGFGGPRATTKEKPAVKVPQRAPDAVVEQTTTKDQAALYRLGGADLNPLHIDPDFAAMGGFKQPILHGLCSLGFSTRHVMAKFAGNEPQKVKAVKCRFTKPVIPGQTLVTEMWKNGSRIHFQTKVKETGTVVISNAYVDLTEGGTAQPVTGAPPAKKSATSDLAAETIFEEIRKRLADQPDMAKTVQAIFEWVITVGGQEAGRWVVDLKNGKGDVYPGPCRDKPGLTLTLEDATMVDVISGKLNPQQAFMNGKLKLKGNIMLATKLQGLLKDQSKL